jgi:hypothetical protein
MTQSSALKPGHVSFVLPALLHLLLLSYFLLPPHEPARHCGKQAARVT